MSGAAELPMFPLGTVLLPGGLLPLHVFEPRYQAMIRHCLAGDGAAEFGQVLITRGRETGGGDERASIGTVAQIVRIDALDGGRYALVALGTRRIRVERWLDDDPFPCAVVVDWPDESDAAPPVDAIRDVTRRVTEIIQLATEVERRAARRERPESDDEPLDSGDVPVGGASAGGPPDELDLAEDPVVAMYQLATVAPIGPADRYRLLAAPGATQRVSMLLEILDDVEAMLRFRLS